MRTGSAVLLDVGQVAICSSSSVRYSPLSASFSLTVFNSVRIANKCVPAARESPEFPTASARSDRAASCSLPASIMTAEDLSDNSKAVLSSPARVACFEAAIHAAADSSSRPWRKRASAPFEWTVEPKSEAPEAAVAETNRASARRSHNADAIDRDSSSNLAARFCQSPAIGEEAFDCFVSFASARYDSSAASRNSPTFPLLALATRR